MKYLVSKKKLKTRNKDGSLKYSILQKIHRTAIKINRKSQNFGIRSQFGWGSPDPSQTTSHRQSYLSTPLHREVTYVEYFGSDRKVTPKMREQAADIVSSKWQEPLRRNDIAAYSRIFGVTAVGPTAEICNTK